MNAPPQSVPRPPRDIEAEMIEAGRTGDAVRLAIAKARYTAWLEDNGYHEHAHGSERPDEAIR